MSSEITSSSIVNPMLGDATPFAWPESMGEVLQRVAAERPNHDALRWIGGRMSYSEFDARTNAIAAELIKRGVRPGEIVGVSVPRSPEFVMLAAAIVKAGAAYMPVDETLPRERLSALLEQALPWYLLTPVGTQLGWVRQFCNVWEIGPDFFNRSLEQWSPPRVSPDATAYILFTSGSTGVPKGVVVVQRGILALVFGGSLCRFSQDEVFLHHSSLSFDASTLEIWGTLLSGATLAVYAEAYPSVEKLQQLFTACAVTSAIFTTTYFNVVVDAAPEIFRDLRRIDIAGEAVSASHVAKAQRLLPGLTLFNAYGPTECTVYSVVCEITPNLASDAEGVPIGRLLRHWFGYILDGQGKLVQGGEIGELHIGGPGLARGYLIQPEGTESPFYRHQELEGGPLLYRTGDLVREGRDGMLYFCGRADSQIKLRGFRIELGEIERKLSSHPLIKQAVVLLQETAVGEKQIVAFSVCRAVIAVEELRAYLTVALPAYMVPSRFITIDEIPLLPSGKCDKRSLLARSRQNEPEVARPSATRADVADEDLSASQVAAEWKRVRRPFPEQESVPSIFRRVVERNHAKTALVDGSIRLTYAELDGVANGLAHELGKLGLGKGSMVGLYLPRSSEFVVAALAVLKCGGAYVPLDQKAPALRLAEIVADAGLGCILAISGTLVPEVGSVPICRVDLDSVPSEPIPPIKDGEIAGSAPAYVIHTSGSTGRPKGVVIPHTGVLRLSIGQVYQRSGNGVKMSFASSATFDASVADIWPTLLNGGELHVYRESVADIQALRAFLQSSGVEVLQMTTALFHLVIDEDPACLEGPRLVKVGGEALSPSHCARLYDVLPGVQIVNAYGPTESSVDSHTFWVPRHLDTGWSTVPIGYPIANTLAIVCDEKMGLVPPGTEGFLLLGGPGLALGYLNLPELTAKAFAPAPFACSGISRFYQTGDRVVENPDGSVEFRGRHDNQVKLRGVRIELGEVERALSMQPGVARSAAVVRAAPSGQRKLVGYVVMQHGLPFSEAVILASLTDRLSGLMLPSHVLELEHFPLNSNGKVNRAALPPPVWSLDKPDCEISDDPVLQAVQALWDEVLGGFRGDASSSFFDAGGDSLDASRVLVRLRQAYGVNIPLSRFVAHPTLAGLAEAVRPQFVGRTVASPNFWLSALRYEPSSFQRRQIFEWSLNPHSTVGNLSHYIVVSVGLDAERLRSAFGQVLARHDILRTCYEISDEKLMARVDPSIPIDFRSVRYPTEMAEAEMLEILRAEAREVYDLRRGPVIRLSVHAVPGGQAWMHLMTHHIAFDGWSLPILLRELQTLYSGSDTTRLAEVFAYSSYARREAAQTGTHAEGINFWKTTLAGFHPLLPLRPVASGTPDQSVCRTVIWRAPLVKAIRTAVATHKTNTLNLLSSSLQIAISRWLRVEDFSLGTVMAVRPTIEAEATIGFFVNPVILRCRVEPETRLEQFIASNHAVLFGALSHAEIPFEEVVTRCGLARDEQADRWFDVMLVLQSNAAACWLSEGKSYQVKEIPPQDTPFSIVLSVTELGDEIEVVSTLRTDRVASSEHDVLMEAWQSVLATMASGGDRLLGNVASEFCPFQISEQEARIELSAHKIAGVAVAQAVQCGAAGVDLVLILHVGANHTQVLAAIASIEVEEGCRIHLHLLPSSENTDSFPWTRWELLRRIQAFHRVPESPSPAADSAQIHALGQKIAVCSSEILGRSQFGLQDDFFTSGGSSLSGLRLVLKLNRELSVRVTLGDLLKLRTPFALALHWLSCSEAMREVSIGKKTPYLDLAPVPIAPVQQRLWFLYRANPASASYHIQFLLVWKTSLGSLAAVQAAQSAWDGLVQGHETLRMRLVDREGQGYLEVVPAELKALEVVDCTDGIAGARKHLLELSRPPFDLLAGPSHRSLLYQLAEGHFALGVVIHHLFFDGWSLNEIAEDFFHALAGSSGQQSTPGSYRQYSSSQWKIRASPEFARAIGFWQGRLSGVDTVLDLGSQRSYGGLFSEAGAVCVRRVGPEIFENVRTRITREGSTLYAFLLAAAALVAVRASGQRKFILGGLVSGRDSAGTDSLVGFCVNTLPLVIEVKPDTSASALVSAVRNLLIDALSEGRAITTLDEIVAAVRPPRETGIPPLVQVALVLEEPPVLSGRPLAAEPALESVPSVFAPFEITIQALATADELILSWFYRPSVYTSVRVNKLADAYLQALDDLLSPEELLLSLSWPASNSASSPVRTKRFQAGSTRPPPSGDVVVWLPIYQQLQEIWEQLLGVPCKDVNQDFFDLGGHSLLALRLIQKIHSSFGVSLTIETLFEARTIIDLSRAILGGTSVDSSKPKLLQAGKGAGQVIYFHGDLASGGLYCRDLFKDILPNWEIWVVHPPSKPTLHLGVPQLAEYYLAQITPILKPGPVVLGGFCLSGWIAFEVAGLLASSGVQVASVFLIDTLRPSRTDRWLRFCLATLLRARAFDQSRALAFFCYGRNLHDRASGWWLRNRDNSLKTWWLRLWKAIFPKAISAPASLAPPHLSTPLSDHDTLVAADAAAAASLLFCVAPYLPKHARLNVRLALSSEAVETANQLASDWSKAGKAPEFRLLPGTHVGIITSSREPLRAWISEVVVLNESNESSVPGASTLGKIDSIRSQDTGCIGLPDELP